VSCRYNYVTPTSYLELLSTFLKLLAEKRTEVTTAKKRLESGLDKLTSTANQVEDMQKELQELQPVLAATAKEVEDMMVVIAHDKEEAAQTKRTVEQQEREANEQAAVAKSIAGEPEPKQLMVADVCETLGVPPRQRFVRYPLGKSASHGPSSTIVCRIVTLPRTPGPDYALCLLPCR
jgi:predicted  nucleic acid-binding Zn-ribbon protein